MELAAEKNSVRVAGGNPIQLTRYEQGSRVEYAYGWKDTWGFGCKISSERIVVEDGDEVHDVFRALELLDVSIDYTRSAPLSEWSKMLAQAVIARKSDPFNGELVVRCKHTSSNYLEAIRAMVNSV